MKMSELKINIELDNAAFDGDAGYEVARILRRMADELEAGPCLDGYRNVLIDIKGNKVGMAVVK